MQPRTRVTTCRFAVALVAAIATTDLLAAAAVPAPLQGKWVPASGTCDSAVRMQVAASALTLTNGSDSQTIGGIEMAGPGYFPPGYRGIEAVLITEFDAQQPVTVTFNADEKKGIARAEFAPVLPGKPTAQLKAYNARISQLNLARRFPLNKVSLKKCA
jgi:hypothetical protein